MKKGFPYVLYVERVEERDGDVYFSGSPKSDAYAEVGEKKFVGQYRLDRVIVVSVTVQVEKA